MCETLAALEAREAAARAIDPVVQRVWARIAADEQQHLPRRVLPDHHARE